MNDSPDSSVSITAQLEPSLGMLVTLRMLWQPFR